jgi:fructokinase
VSVAAERPVVVGGEALVDLVAADGAGDALRALPGGGPFNTARTLARLGRATSFLGRLSTDRFGTRLEQMLAEDGVDLGSVVRTDEPTTLALAELDAAGSATYRFYDRGTSAAGLTPTEALDALPADPAALHVGTLGLVLEPVASALEAVVLRLADHALVVLDPNVRPTAIPDPAAFRARLDRLIARTDVVKASEEDLAWLAPGAGPAQAARDLLDRGPSAVLVTLGGEGALVVHGTGDVEVTAPRVEVVDTIGAGDAFAGGVLGWWLEHGLGTEALADRDRVAQATAFGCRVAALTCTRPGADPPRRAELGDA